MFSGQFCYDESYWNVSILRGYVRVSHFSVMYVPWQLMKQSPSDRCPGSLQALPQFKKNIEIIFFQRKCRCYSTVPNSNLAILLSIPTGQSCMFIDHFLCARHMWRQEAKYSLFSACAHLLECVTAGTSLKTQQMYWNKNKTNSTGIKNKEKRGWAIVFQQWSQAEIQFSQAIFLLLTLGNANEKESRSTDLI